MLVDAVLADLHEEASRRRRRRRRRTGDGTENGDPPAEPVMDINVVRCDPK